MIANGTTIEVVDRRHLRAGASHSRGSSSSRAIRSGSTSSSYAGKPSLDRAPREGIFELVAALAGFRADHVASLR